MEDDRVEDDDETLIQDNLFAPVQAATEEPILSSTTLDALSSSDDDSDLDISKPKTDMINVADITKMSQADIMRLTFENDDVAEVSEAIASFKVSNASRNLTRRNAALSIRTSRKKRI